MPMPAESGDQRRVKSPLPPPEQQEHLPCPRCDSTNTKFCYYNNYNFSQPRHFCKSCRRYWTQGGTLRDIPVGGATRKSAKRSRTLPPPQTSSSSAPHFSVPLPSMAGSFTSLLNSSATSLALGGLGLGIGPGFDDAAFGPLGRALWAFPEVGYFTSNATGAAGGIGNGTLTTTGVVDVGAMNAWQLETGTDQAAAGGFVGGDCFPSWPELAISTPGNGLK